MMMKINKACDLSSISVLPPPLRRSTMVRSGPESSSIFGKSQPASDLISRQQKPQYSQQSLSQGISSQGLFSQFSQNSQDEILTNEKIASQERDISVKRTSCLPRTNYTREENQIIIPRSSSNLMRKWSGQEYKCQISEELEHKMGLLETSVNRLGMVLDSVQSDIMHVNKGTKEVALEMEGMRQKFNALDDSVQSMNKKLEDIRTSLELGLTTVSNKLIHNKKDQEIYREIFSILAALSEKIDKQMGKPQTSVCKNFNTEMQAMSGSMKNVKQIQAIPFVRDSKASSGCGRVQEVPLLTNATVHSKLHPGTVAPKNETGGWTSVKHNQTISKVGNPVKRISQEEEHKVLIESDEEIDGGFSCLLKENETEKQHYSFEKVQEETARILRRARRKRKFCNTIIIN